MIYLHYLIPTSGNRQDLTNILKQNVLQFTISRNIGVIILVNSQEVGTWILMKYSPFEKNWGKRIVYCVGNTRKSATFLNILFPTAVIITKFFHS